MSYRTFKACGVSLLSMLTLPETALAQAREESGAMNGGSALARLGTGSSEAPLRLLPVSDTGLSLADNGANLAAEGPEIVVAYMQAADPAAEVPPPLPPVPASEAVQERAPANPAVRAYPRQADGHGIKLGGYNVSRWAEDWRMMRDPKKRDDLLDRLKYLPLGSGDTAYVTLSGEVRLRSNTITNPGLTSSEYRRENLLRLFAGADVHVGPLRVFGELAHGELSGHNYGAPSGKSRNDLIAQQLFGEISGDIDGVGLGIRFGRQEFTDGTSGFLSQRDDNNIHYPMSGVRAWAQTKGLRIGVFDLEMVKLGPSGTKDDKADPDTRFSGINLGVVIAETKDKKVFLDPFFWRERNSNTLWGRVSGREERFYLGTRLWGSIAQLTFDWTLSHQHGDFVGRDIDAWNAFIAQTYKLSSKGLQPKAGIHFDLGSGGGTFRGDTLRISRAPTAGTIGYSYQGALNVTNLFQVSPNITVTPLKNVDVTTELQRSWRLSERDAVYRGAGTAYAGSQNIAGSHVGDAIRLQASWKITPRASLMGRYEHFMPASILKALNYTRSSYLAVWSSFRF